MILLYSTTILQGLYYIWRLLYWHVYILVKHVFIVVSWILSRLHYMCLKPLLYLCFTPINIPILSIVNTLLHHVIVSSYREFYHDIIYIRSCLLPSFLYYTLPLLLYITTLHYITLYYTIPHYSHTVYNKTTLTYKGILYTSMEYFTL